MLGRMAATGAGLLWLGWFGFNGGSALTSGALAANTLVVSHVAASTSACVWLFLDWTLVGRPTFVGVINGAISGLAGVTPASGYVLVQSSFSIGLIVGAASYGGVYLFKDRLRIDDALDVSSVHGVTGVSARRVQTIALLTVRRPAASACARSAWPIGYCWNYDSSSDASTCRFAAARSSARY